jgi:hypothetical protein
VPYALRPTAPHGAPTIHYLHSMKFSFAAAALFAATAVADVDPIVIKGSKFFYKSNGTQLWVAKHLQASSGDLI